MKNIDWDDETYVDLSTGNTVGKVTVDGRKMKFLFTEEVIEDRGIDRCVQFATDLIQDRDLTKHDQVLVKTGKPFTVTFL